MGQFNFKILLEILPLLMKIIFRMWLLSMEELFMYSVLSNIHNLHSRTVIFTKISLSMVGLSFLTNLKLIFSSNHSHLYKTKLK
jgi:hypothetical protein